MKKWFFIICITSFSLMAYPHTNRKRTLSSYRYEKEETFLEINDKNLALELNIEGKTSLHVGETLYVTYRYKYNTDIELTKEDLPLLNPPGFIKIGNKEIKEYSQGNTTIFEVRQQLEADKPGIYKIPPSIIEGYPYIITPDKKRKYAKEKLSSKTSPVSLEVLSLPSSEDYLSFTGTCANDLEISASVANRGHLKTDTPIQLRFSINTSDSSAIKQISPPKIDIQPGILGFFHIDKLPFPEKISSSQKTFFIEMQPLASMISEVPSIEYTYFDSSRQKFISLQTTPIPLIRDAPLEKKYIKDQKKSFPASEKTKHPLSYLTLLDISGIAITPSTLLCFFLMLSCLLFLYLPKIPASIPQKEHTSFQLFKQASKNKNHRSFHSLLRDALIKKLEEKNYKTSDDPYFKKLPNNPFCNTALSILNLIEKKQYSLHRPNPYISPSQYLTKSASLFHNAYLYKNFLKKFFLLYKSPFYLLALLLGLFIYTIPFSQNSNILSFNKIVREINNNTSSSTKKKKRMINTAIHKLLMLEKKHDLHHSTGKIFHNLALLYNELGEYAIAISYYYKTLKTQPRNTQVTQELNEIQKQLHLPLLTSKNSFFSFSLSEKLQLLIVFLITLTLSWFASKKSAKIKKFFPLIVCSLLLFGNICYIHFHSPIEAVCIKYTPLFHDKHYSQKQPQSLFLGEKITIMPSDTNSIKISKNKHEGFVPMHVVKTL